MQIMKTKFSLLIFVLLSLKGLGQSFSKQLTPAQYLASTGNSSTYSKPGFVLTPNQEHVSRTLSMGQGDKDSSHLNKGQRLCLISSLALLAGSFAVHNSNNNLAIGLASTALLTSSVGLVWYIRDQKRR